MNRSVRELDFDEFRLDGGRRADEFLVDRDTHRFLGPA